MRRLWNVLTTSVQERRQQTEIEQVAPQFLPVKAAGGSLPRFYATSRGDPPEIEFDVPLADDREIEMIYSRRYDEFVEDSDTNWLLNTHYEAYLRAALIEAELYLRNDERAATWVQAFQQVAGEVRRTQRGRDYAQPMSVRATQPVF